MTTRHESRTSSDSTGTITTVRLQDVIRLAWNGKWYLIGCLLVSLGLGAGYLTKAEPIYKVGARLLVQQAGFRLEQGERKREDKDFLATQAEIIRSPAVVEQAAGSLEAMPDDGAGTKGVTSILGSLRVSPLTGTNVLSISFHSRHEELAVQTVNAVIDSYKNYLQEMDRDSNFESLNLLTRNEKALRNDIEGLEARYRKLRKESPLMGQGIQAASVQRTLLENLGKALSETRTRRIELENQIRVMKTPPATHVALASGDALITTVSASTPSRSAKPSTKTIDLVDWRGAVVPNTQNEDYLNLRSFQEQLALAEIRKQTIERQFGEKHPGFKSVQEEIRVWKRIMQETIENAPQVLERDLATIELQEQRLDDLYQKEFEKAKVVDGHLLEEQQALDDIERVQLIHDSILSQLRELQLVDQALVNGRSRVRVGVLEGPSLGDNKIWPQKSLLLVGCAAIGLMTGMGLAASFAHPPATTVQSSEGWRESNDSAVIV